jgi:hypothetical protein
VTKTEPIRAFLIIEIDIWVKRAFVSFFLEYQSVRMMQNSSLELLGMSSLPPKKFLLKNEVNTVETAERNRE